MNSDNAISEVQIQSISDCGNVDTIIIQETLEKHPKELSKSEFKYVK